jgi:hypothetical protein
MKFIIDGFPRQGNTTLSRVIKNVFANKLANEYPSHDLESIKMDIALGNTLLFPVRNPINTLGSFVGMQMLKFPECIDEPMHHHLIDSALNTLKIFQDYIIENVNQVNIIKFEDIIKMSEDYKNQNIQNNKTINRLSKEYDLKIAQVMSPLFDSFSEYSSTKNLEVEEQLLGEEFKEILDLILKNYNYLVNKSY